MSRPSRVTERRAGVARACLLAAMVAAVVALAVGGGRGFSQSLLLNLSGVAVLRRVAMNVAVALFFVPVVAAMMAVWTVRLRAAQRVVAIAAILALCLLGEPAWTARVIEAWHLNHAAFWRMVLSRSDTNLIFSLAGFGLTRVVARRAERERVELAAANIRELNADAQLYVMALQLQPHFLFNALNLASQLAFTNVDAALETLGNLRTLLARSLELARSREVSLRDELAFLESYTSIQTRRFRDRLTVSVQADGDVLSASVPHLTLQPLVENAIAHGIAPLEEGGRVSVTAQRTGGRLRIAIDDTGPGVRAPITEGVGLGITRRRLAQVFGDDFTLTVAKGSGGGTCTLVDIPFRAFTGAAESGRAEPEVPSEIVLHDGEPAWRRVPFWLRLGVIWVIAAALWIAAGAFASPYDSLPRYSRGIAVGSALLWATFSLIPLGLAKRFDLTERADRRRVWLHVVAAVATSVVHLATWFALLASVDRVQRILQGRAQFAWFVWDLMAYASIVTLVWIGKLGSRVFEARRDVRRIHSELRDARVAAMRLRLQPVVLFRALDAAADAVRRAPEAAELSIARLGDLLRMLLRAADREYVSVMEECELLAAYLALTGGEERVVADVVAHDAIIPATLTLAVLHAVGETGRLTFSADDEAITLRATSDAPVDPLSVLEIDERLQRDYGAAATMQVTPGAFDIRISNARRDSGDRHDSLAGARPMPA